MRVSSQLSSHSLCGASAAFNGSCSIRNEPKLFSAYHFTLQPIEILSQPSRMLLLQCPAFCRPGSNCLSKMRKDTPREVRSRSGRSRLHEDCAAFKAGESLALQRAASSPEGGECPDARRRIHAPSPTDAFWCQGRPAEPLAQRRSSQSDGFLQGAGTLSGCVKGKRVRYHKSPAPFRR